MLSAARQVHVLLPFVDGKNAMKAYIHSIITFNFLMQKLCVKFPGPFITFKGDQRSNKFHLFIILISAVAASGGKYPAICALSDEQKKPGIC